MNGEDGRVDPRFDNSRALRCSGDPNGQLVAPVGAVAVSRDGTYWVKTAGLAAVGWERQIGSPKGAP